MFFLRWVHLVAILGLAANELTLPLLIPLARFDFLGNTLCVHIVHDGTQRRNIGGRLHAGIDAV